MKRRRDKSRVDLLAVAEAVVVWLSGMVPYERAEEMLAMVGQMNVSVRSG